MPRVRMRRLTRKQLRTLRNPLPSKGLRTDLYPDKAQFEEAKAEALGAIRPTLSQINALMVPPLPRKKVFDFAKEVSAYLAAQQFPVFRRQPGVGGDLGELVLAYLGLDSPTLFQPLVAASSANPRLQAKLVPLIQHGTQLIQAFRDAGAQSAPPPPAAEEVEYEEEAPEQDADEIAQFLAQPWQAIRLQISEWADDLSLSDLRKAQRIEISRSRGGRKKVLKVLAEFLAASVDSQAAAARVARVQRSSRDDASVPDPTPSMSSIFSQVVDFEEEEEEDEEEDDEPTSDQDPRPRRGATSPGADPKKVSASSLALTKPIRGALHRKEARDQRVEGFTEDMLPFRRAQARSRSANVNVPVLYAPPKDVLDKIEEIRAADRRKERAMQFQDVLVFVLQKDHAVGRGKVIPAGSVEVYNKGTLVGTFGRNPITTNIRNAMFYAGWLVGLNLGQRRYEAKKSSRMDSRIYYALQGQAGFSLVAPSLNEVLRQTPVRIELDLEESKAAALGEARNNPRRSAMVQSIGSARFEPTAKGYRVLNGPLKGAHYTTSNFGHGCKLAMILDLTSGKL